MTLDDLIAAYSSLPVERQTRVLASYAWWLTISARGTYVVGSEDIANPHRLRMLNETQHSVIEHICHLLDGNLQRYPDDVLVNIIVAGEDPELLSRFERVIAHECR
jgi:hypothetical protein